MADERRIFPTETVLELVAGKKDADTSDLACFLLGRQLLNSVSAKAAAPFAAAWLARWYPKFADVEWKEDIDWNHFSAQTKAKLGAQLSLAPITGRMKALADEVIDALTDSHECLLRQTDAAVKLEQKVKELEPLSESLKTLQKKNDELEARLKAAKTDMGALQRKVNEFEGKLAIDNDELMQTIKSAIKDGLKGMAVGAGVAAAAAGPSDAGKPAPAAPISEEDEWDMPKSSASDDDEWG